MPEESRLGLEPVHVCFICHELIEDSRVLHRVVLVERSPATGGKWLESGHDAFAHKKCIDDAYAISPRVVPTLYHRSVPEFLRGEIH